MDREVFADRLHNGLSTRGISPAELSRRTGIPARRLARLQEGPVIPTGFEMAGISKVLGVPANWLAGSNDPKDNTWQKPKGSGQVIGFINDFLGYHGDAEAAKTLQEQFRTGYCYHFALMLKGLFVRGQVVWLAPYEQIGWQDDDGVVYTVGGVYQDDGEPIPVSWLGDAIKDFSRISGEHFGASSEYIQEIIRKYHSCPGQTELGQQEALVQIGQSVYLHQIDWSMYLHIQASDEGWDYTWYDAKDYRLIDGGQLDQPELSLEKAVRQIAAARGMKCIIGRQLPIALLDEILEANKDKEN